VLAARCRNCRRWNFEAPSEKLASCFDAWRKLPLGSLRLEIDSADYPAPFLDFIADELSEFGRRPGKYGAA
jgi:hypothetical protein